MLINSPQPSGCTHSLFIIRGSSSWAAAPLAGLAFLLVFLQGCVLRCHRGQSPSCLCQLSSLPQSADWVSYLLVPGVANPPSSLPANVPVACYKLCKTKQGQRWLGSTVVFEGFLSLPVAGGFPLPPCCYKMHLAHHLVSFLATGVSASLAGLSVLPLLQAANPLPSAT